ncbi:MAG: 16S rRNA processing protein RimM [Gemmatimonadetes bacterium]|uniref:Ribosome maturation factor RimM n=1 Tax=Candidatus Kutchimonas denitrificans TaxID=3056748 RepID=A0AAE5CCM0_9BACT|nr:16S rRNA processing protein RimM [Gemmatimonadota bacterium]NIR76143.1 16S rRNA processing protein RimM [Candidatus Kutchimonas denitrificans]NIS00522.1 16S rRNA processing protein RimM [Gemmatimonadota bacterium]NIT66180.1 16S rRNA processing protein RimM [Gemmatimonadota bacterium]NIU54258.1 16S rRNA processing protein RimM [Gemmatimonadota bacterium]
MSEAGDADERKDADTGHLTVGEIRRAHGIKGECIVTPTTDDVVDVYAAGRVLPLGDRDGRRLEPEERLTVRRARPTKGGLIVQFDEITDRTQAGSLSGTTLLLARDEVRPLDEGEMFVHDLFGLEVYLVDGGRVGRVADVYEGATGYILGVEGANREHLIPLGTGIVRELDLASRRLIIEPPPGLLET